MVITQKLTRINRLLLVALLVFAVSLPLLNSGKAGAYALPSSRSIKMSSSVNGTLTAGQDVTYLLSFTTNQDGATVNVGGLVLEFCSNSPIIGDACTAPAGFNTNAHTASNTLVLGTQTGTGGNNFVKNTTNATANRLILSRPTPGTPQIAPNTAITIELGTAAAGDGVTNPSTTNKTFFARVLTFATQVGAEEYESTDIDDANNNSGVLGNGPHVIHDAGGFAMSTAAQITITSKVPEKLTFCVFTSDDTGAPNTCGTGTGFAGNLGGTAVTLGDNNAVLSDLEEFVNKDAKYTIATNALFGVAIRVKGGTLKTSITCPETPGQNCSIDAIGGAVDPGTVAINAPGTEQFGFCTYQSFGAGITPATPYDDAECNTTVHNSGIAPNNTANDAAVAGTAFGFFNDSTTGTTSTYGDIFANKVSGTFSTGIIAFLGNISTTTEPGIYTTTLIFIATGTY